MDISIYALEKLLKEHEENISNSTKQLRDIESGKIQLSNMKIASVENTLENSQKEYAKYKEIYDAIPEKEKEKYKELQRVQEALAKQSYYKLQKVRLKRNLNLKRKQRLEAMMVIDELPEGVHFEDKQLLDVANVIIKYNIREVVELENLLLLIKDEFHNKLEKLQDSEDLKHFHFLDTYIPIIILYFHVFIEEIKESIETYNDAIDQIGDRTTAKDNSSKMKVFNGLPKYEDWWINELFKNHQAYFALFKWKEIIENICVTEQQKIIWDKIFNNWLMIKKILNNKEENAYEYTLIFDQMMSQYVELEEELEIENIRSMENIITDVIKKENFTDFHDKHEITTTYLQWKKSNIDSLNKN
jgi:hypothetical protein